MLCWEKSLTFCVQSIDIDPSENWYTLTNKHNLSHSTLHRLKHNKDVSTRTLNDLCRILGCNVADIVQYLPSDKDQEL